MTDSEIVDLMADAAQLSCKGEALCGCDRVTEIWIVIEPELRKRMMRWKDEKNSGH